MGSHDYNIKYLMGQFRNSQSVNDDTFIRLGLENKSNLVQPDESLFILDAYQQYNIENNNSTKYRFSGKIRVITDNSIGAAWNVSPQDKDWNPEPKDNNNITRNWILQVTYPSELDEEFEIKGVNAAYRVNPVNNNIVTTKAFEGIQIEKITKTQVDGIDRVLVTTIQKNAVLPGEFIYLKPTGSSQVLNYLGFHKVLRLDPNNEERGLILETEFPQSTTIFKGTVKRVLEPSLSDFNFYNAINIEQIQACDEDGNLVGLLNYTKIITENHDLQIGDFVDIRFNDSSDLNGVWRVVAIPNINNFVVRYEIPNATGNIININGTSNITNEPLTLNYRKLDGIPSEYYVRKFEVLTEVKDYEIYNGGYENTIFVDQYSNGSSLFHFNKDADIEGKKDHLGRPLSELYITITRRSSYGSDSNYFRGWSDVTSFFDNNKDVVTINGIEPSLILETLSYWQNNDNNSSGTIQYPNVGQKLVGDFVEFNRGELLERNLAEVVYRFRPVEIDPATTDPNNAIYTTNREGYYYYPHNKIEIRKFSEAIQSEEQKEDEIYPDYVISDNNGNFIWRELLPINFFETGDNGIDYPFVNGCHYLFENYSIYIRKQLPTGAKDFSVNQNEFKPAGKEISGEKC